MKLFSLSTLLFFVLASPAFGAIEATYSGFVNSSLWFDREPFFAGQEVRIYTTLGNSSFADFAATIEFYDGEELINNTEVVLERNGGFQIVWSDWTPEEGDHTITVKITQATLTPPEGEPEEALYENEPTYSITRFVDTDTDGDGIGNIEDNDDDNDGIPDDEDDNPLVADVEVAPPSILGNGPIQRASRALEVLKEISAQAAPTIISGVENAIDVIEDFRIAQSENIKKKIKEVEEEIEQEEKEAEKLAEREGGDKENKKKDRPFDHLGLLALTAAGYTLDNKFAFYIAGAFMLYMGARKIIPWTFRLIRGRKDEY